MTKVATLQTERFTLRPLQRSDAAALFPTFADPEQCRYLTRAEFTSEEELWGWLSEPSWPGLTWIAVDESGEVVGRLVAVPGHAPDVFEIGYIICKHRQRDGAAQECTSALISHLWEPDGDRPAARKLTAEVDPRNAASVHLLEKLGFTREAHLREHDVTHIGVCDVYWYAVLRAEWSS